MKPYEKYKDSRIEWLGEIPVNWTVNKLKYLLTVNDETLSENTPEDYYIQYVEISDVSQEKGINNSTLMPFSEAPSRARRIVKSGDVIVSTVRTYLKAIARINDCPENLIVSTGFAVLRPKFIDSGFLGYSMISDGIINEIISNSVGVSYPAINSTQLVKIAIPTPSLPEQTQIAKYLDHQTAIIDELIAQKEQLITLLKQKRQAVINEAVTKGLNPNAKMKDSGIEWIGEIPENWSAIRISRLTSVKRGASPRPIDDMVYFDENGEYGWVRIKDVTASERYLEFTEERLSELGSSKSVKLEPGNLFLSIAGSVGKPIINKIKCCIHDGFVYFPELKINVEYLYYIFSTGEIYNGLGKLGTQLNLNTDTVGGITIPMPSSIEEIENIVSYLDHQTSSIDELISKNEQFISSMKSYRQSLISEAVTGKIDLRDWQPKE